MDNPTIWVFGIEPIETRYTHYWHDSVPALLVNKLGNNFNVVRVDGVQKNTQVTPGAFLNFSDTNYWKSSQLCSFLDYFNDGKVSKNDHFIFVDAWNPVILQVKYMRDLLQTDWVLHGMWHAGGYDKHDFLGRYIGQEPWINNVELAMFESLDHNYFASTSHIDMFIGKRLNISPIVGKRQYMSSDIIVKTGWPMEFMEDVVKNFVIEKTDTIVFPHRIAPEKQVDIFLDIAKTLPQYEFVVCQSTSLSKKEYYDIMARSKITFSCSLQETLGLGQGVDGPLFECIPLSPNRLSYSEIFSGFNEFLYNSKWTESWDLYLRHKPQLINVIKYTMDNYSSLKDRLVEYVNTNYKEYFEAESMINIIKGYRN